MINEIKFIGSNSSITKKSYTDFDLILTGQNIEVPKAKIYTVDVEGIDGKLDLSEFFGEIKYENRTLKFTFETIEKISDWQSRMSMVSSFLHGQKMKIEIWSDPDFYYVGRCFVDEYSSSARLGKIVISCDAEPYKYKQNITTFNLTSGTNTVNNSRMTAFADLMNESEIKINNRVYGAGTHLRAIKLTCGANKLVSNGVATLTFQEGEL